MESCCCNFHTTEMRFPRRVRESHIAHPHEGVQTWKPKPEATKGFPQRNESSDSHGRVPRRELIVLIQWQDNLYIRYCYLWYATAPNSLFFAGNKASELSDTSMSILLFSWYNCICLHSSPGNHVLQKLCLSVQVCGITYHYVVVLIHFFMYWLMNCYCLCSWRV